MEELKRYAEQYGLCLSDRQLEHFQTYEHLLLDWNQRMNLTAITDHNEIIIKHFLDSLVLVNVFSPKPGAAVIDVGTGAGFPGIPLKIYREDLKLTLLDSLQKRILFLEAVSSKVDQVDNRCIHSRAEDAGHDPSLREQYDLACARAVASLPTLCEFCLPFVKVGGMFAAMKARESMEEVAASAHAISTLGGQVKDIAELTLPNDNSRTILLIEKIHPTPAPYPRKPAKIAKNPLG